MRKSYLGWMVTVALSVPACELDARLALTGNAGGAAGSDGNGVSGGEAGAAGADEWPGGAPNMGGALPATGGSMDGIAGGSTLGIGGGTPATGGSTDGIAGGSTLGIGGGTLATGGSTSTDFDRASVLVLERYPECSSYVTKDDLEVKNGIVRFNCGLEVDGPEYYIKLDSGELISTCGGACRDSDPEQDRMCQTMCPPPLFGDCVNAGGSTAELPQCRAIDFCLADRVVVAESEGLFECVPTDGSSDCEGTTERQAYTFSSDRIDITFSVDRSLVGHFEPGSMWSAVELDSVVLRFPDQSRLLSEVDPDAFAYGEVERADLFAVVGMAQEISAQGIDYTADGKLRIWIALDGSSAQFRTSSSDYDVCWSDDIVGICACVYEKTIAGRIDLELPVESEL